MLRLLKVVSIGVTYPLSMSLKQSAMCRNVNHLECNKTWELSCPFCMGEELRFCACGALNVKEYGLQVWSLKPHKISVVNMLEIGTL